jgi:hypothetical protein
MANDTVIIALTAPQQDALRLMSLTDNATELVEAAFSSQLKSKIKYYRNGAIERDSNGDKIVLGKDKNGKPVYKMKGGLKSGAEAAYEMAKQYLPADVTKAKFVASALKEVDDVITRLSAKETDYVASESDDDSSDE